MEITYYHTHGKSTGFYMDAVTEDEFGNVIHTRQVSFPLIERLDNHKVIFLQYNDHMELLYDVCEYLNFYIAGSSEKTRRFKAGVLRRYVCFMVLLGYPYNDLQDQYAIDRVASFFRGEDYRSHDNVDHRSHASANNYLSVVRDFCRFCNRGKASKLDSLISNVDKRDVTEDGKRFPKRYPSSLIEDPHAHDNVKPFLYPEEFKSLVDLANKWNDVQALIIFHLMYFYGLRIGECLGLTEEDFEIRRRNSEPSPILLLRNRLSDKSFQYCKELFHPSSEKDYLMRSYPSAKVRLTMEFYEKLTMFVASVAKKSEECGIRNRAEAECISKTYKYEHGSNHYIFVNKYGKPLSQQAWNRRLKDYFMAAGIELDIGVKRDNLNHRFRHGCAMYYLRFAERKMSLDVLQSFMRHKSVNTTSQYLKVTIDEDIVLHQDFQNSLVKAIPFLYD